MCRSPALVALVALLSVGCLSEGDPERSPSGPDAFPVQDRAAPVVSESAGSVSRYRPPVVAPVTDGFRPPPGPFAAGNRGIEYRTEPGTPVGAIGAGRVVFAGPVAGARHVTVHHGDGLRSSYSFLETIAVAVDDPVAAGQSVGTATERLHLGVRAGDAYLDPALLFDRGGVRLVPVP